MRTSLRSRTIVTLLTLILASAALVTGASASSRIAFSSGSWIESISARGSGQHRIAPAPRKTSDLASTDDGRWIAALSNRGAPGPRPAPGRTEHRRQVYLIGSHGGSRQVFPHELRVSGDDKVAISPDGDRIAFGRDNEIWVIRSDGTGIRQVTDGFNGTAFSPAFTPDGRSLVFARFIGRGAPRLFRTRLSGGPEVALTPPGRASQDPTISDSGLIAYLESGGESVRLRTMRPDGSGNRIVYRSRPGQALYDPDFSPSGRSIVLVGGRGYRFDERRYSIFTVRATGGGEQTVLGGLRDHHASRSGPGRASRAQRRRRRRRRCRRGRRGPCGPTSRRR